MGRSSCWMVFDKLGFARHFLLTQTFRLLLIIVHVMPAKLYFRYGVVHRLDLAGFSLPLQSVNGQTMSCLWKISAKTLNLLAVAHTYQQQGKNVLLLKPGLDDRYGVDIIQSKAGLHRRADVLIKNSTNLLLDISMEQRRVDCILVDEVQTNAFFTLQHLILISTVI